MCFGSVNTGLDSACCARGVVGQSRTGGNHVCGGCVMFCLIVALPRLFTCLACTSARVMTVQPGRAGDAGEGSKYDIIKPTSGSSYQHAASFLNMFVRLVE